VQTLASGQTETGTFSGGGGDSTSGYIGVGVTYVQPLASPLTHGVEDTFGGTTTECPGYPNAAPGWMCLYPFFENNTAAGYGYTGFNTPDPGAVLYWPITGSGSYVGGFYAVTAP